MLMVRLQMNQIYLSFYWISKQKLIQFLVQTKLNLKFVIDSDYESEDKELNGVEYSKGISAWKFFYSGIRKYVLSNLD